MELFERKIMAVDDHRGIRKMIDAILRENGYTKIISAGNIMLPGEDGFSLFGKIRERSDVPILFLSAKDEDADRLYGLGLGADDYMTKPFLPEELALRINVILKRTYHVPEILPERAVVRYQEKEVPLTAKELMLLTKLNENRGRIVTFDALCDAVWGDSYYGYENTLMVHIRHLREKLEDWGIVW